MLSALAVALSLPLSPQEPPTTPAQDPADATSATSAASSAEEAEIGAKVKRGERTGLIPLIDLGADTYKGYEGGLYPGGANRPPEAHLEAALAEAARIQPLSRTGEPDPVDGRIGLVAIGLSTTAHKFGSFERRSDADPRRNPRLVLVNGGHAGNSSEFMVAERTQYWDVLAEKVRASGLTRQQVQVVWICQRRGPRAWKLAQSKLPTASTVPGFEPPERRRKAKDSPQKAVIEPAIKTFPEGPRQLRDQLGSIVRNVRTHYPNARLCYFSDRMPWPEPQSYETGFGIKWLIEQQLGGRAELNHDPERGEVQAPLLLWGPYLWADGDLPNGNGTTWGLDDFEVGDAHPSGQGEDKVAALLEDFLTGDPTAAPWYLRGEEPALLVLDAVADAHTSPTEPDASFGAEPTLLATGGKRPGRVYLRFDLTGVERPVRYAKLSLRIATERKTPFALHVAATGSDWSESELTADNAPEPGERLGTMPVGTRDGTRALDLTAAVNALAGDRLDLVLTSAAVFDSTVHSRARESGHPPRLILAPTPR